VPAGPGAAAAAAARRGRRRERAVAVALLFAAAATVGLLLAPPATRVLAAHSGFDYPSFLHFDAAPAVVAIVAGLAALGAVVAWGVGLLPRRGPAGWAGVAFVVAQAGFALWVGSQAVRLERDLGRKLHADLGFAPAGVLTFRIDLKGPRYMDNRRVGDLLRQVYLPRLAAVPGVGQVALSNPTQPTDGMSGGYITIDDHDSKAADGTYMTMWHSVSPDYFAVLGIPVLAGRAFTASDTDSNAVIVSKPTADLHWPGRDPLGRRLKQDARNVQSEPWMTVVGVVAGARDEGFGEARPAPDIYMSIFEFPLRLPLTINFLVRPRPGLAPADLWPALQREMQAIAPEVPPYDVATLDERLAKQTSDQRYQLILRALAAGLLLLAAVAGACAIVPRGEAHAEA
jgi:putative ABC transport system permease protein